MEPQSWAEVSIKGGWKPIEKWLQDVYQKPNNVLTIEGFAVILGTSGCGKTLQFRLLCESLGIRLQWIEGYNGKEIIERLEKVYSSDLIGHLQEATHKRAIVLDDVDVICSQDRMFSSYLLHFIQSKKHKWIPLIALGNSAYEKKFGELGRQLTPFKLPLLSIGDTFLYLEKCSSYFKLNLKEDVLLAIAKLCQGNYTKAFETIQCYTDKTLVQTEEHSTFDVIMELPSSTNMIYLFYEDTYGTLLRFHENLYLEIHRRISKIVDKKKWYGCIFKLLLDLEHALSQESRSLEITLEPLIIKWVEFCSKYPRKDDTTVEHEFTRLLSRMSLHKKHARKMFQFEYWKESPYLMNNLLHNKKSCS